MGRHCNVEVLSSSGQWEDVFACLGIDQDKTIDLSQLQVPSPLKTPEIRDNIANVTILDIVLALILFTDQLFLITLIFYCALFMLSYFRVLLLSLFYKFEKTVREKIPKLRNEIIKNKIN